MFPYYKKKSPFQLCPSCPYRLLSLMSQSVLSPSLSLLSLLFMRVSLVYLSFTCVYNVTTREVHAHHVPVPCVPVPHVSVLHVLVFQVSALHVSVPFVGLCHFLVPYTPVICFCSSHPCPVCPWLLYLCPSRSGASCLRSTCLYCMSLVSLLFMSLFLMPQHVVFLSLAHPKRWTRGLAVPCVPSLSFQKGARWKTWCFSFCWPCGENPDCC